VDDADLLAVLHEAASAVRQALDGLDDWSLAGTRPGQYRSDLAADEVAVAILDAAGLGVVSEESGAHGEGRDIVVVLDPVDGSTNASRGIPWYATSLCALDSAGPRVGLVANQATGARYWAVRGEGAHADGRPLAPRAVKAVADAVVGLAGYPPRHLGWGQMRALGASALDFCAVAGGLLDAFVDCTRDAHGPWDYLAGMLVCHEAGAATADAFGRDLVTTDHAARRTPLAAATPELLDALVAARSQFG
jgi:myo-inositol-1(or 4)-monophosphatase